MKNNGTVLKIEGDFAIVGVKRQSACDTCRAKCGGHCDKAETVKTKVKNTLFAKVGDEVVLYTKTSTVLTYSFAVFVMPIVLAFLGYLIPHLLKLDTAVSVVLSVVMFFMSFIIIRFIWGKKEAHEQIEMIEIKG